jgi:hypothetical protein
MSAEQLGEVCDDDVGTVLSKRVRLPDPVDTDDEAEPSGSSRGDADKRILEHRGLARWHIDEPRRGQEHVRGRLSPQMLPFGDHRVDPCLEQVGDTGRLKHLTTVGARGDDRAPQAGLPSRLHEPDRPLVRTHAATVDHRESELVLTVGQTSDRLGVMGIVVRPLWELDAS